MHLAQEKQKEKEASKQAKLDARQKQQEEKKQAKQALLTAQQEKPKKRVRDRKKEKEDREAKARKKDNQNIPSETPQQKEPEILPTPTTVGPKEGTPAKRTQAPKKLSGNKRCPEFSDELDNELSETTPKNQKNSTHIDPTDNTQDSALEKPKKKRAKTETQGRRKSVIQSENPLTAQESSHINKNEASNRVGPVKTSETQDEEDTEKIERIPLGRIEIESVTVAEYYRRQREAKLGNYPGGPNDKSKYGPDETEHPLESNQDRNKPEPRDSKGENSPNSTDIFETRQPETDDEKESGKQTVTQRKYGGTVTIGLTRRSH